MPSPSATASPTSPPHQGAEERLLKLKSLLDKKLITPDEYQKKRIQILGDL